MTLLDELPTLVASRTLGTLHTQHALRSQQRAQAEAELSEARRRHAGAGAQQRRFDPAIMAVRFPNRAVDVDGRNLMYVAADQAGASQLRRSLTTHVGPARTDSLAEEAPYTDAELADALGKTAELELVARAELEHAHVKQAASFMGPITRTVGALAASGTNTGAKLTRLRSMPGGVRPPKVVAPQAPAVSVPKPPAVAAPPTPAVTSAAPVAKPAPAAAAGPTWGRRFSQLGNRALAVGALGSVAAAGTAAYLGGKSINAAQRVLSEPTHATSHWGPGGMQPAQDVNEWGAPVY